MISCLAEQGRGRESGGGAGGGGTRRLAHQARGEPGERPSPSVTAGALDLVCRIKSFQRAFEAKRRTPCDPSAFGLPRLACWDFEYLQFGKDGDRVLMSWCTLSLPVFQSRVACGLLPAFEAWVACGLPPVSQACVGWGLGRRGRWKGRRRFGSTLRRSLPVWWRGRGRRGRAEEGGPKRAYADSCKEMGLGMGFDVHGPSKWGWG
jgi:hypothetical protein